MKNFNSPISKELAIPGVYLIWNSTAEAARILNISHMGIQRVIKGDRKSYKESIWSDARLKLGELLENPTIKYGDNQQPSLSSNTFEGSTTNSRVLTDNTVDSNANTSAQPSIFI
jgi:hypothetical protein